MLEKLAAGMLGSAVGSVLGGLFGAKKTEAASGFNITTLLGGVKEKTEADKLGINTSDSVSAGTQDGLSLLREMTDGGIAGYWKFMMKQMREKAMESMGVTEESLAAMDPAERKVIEDKIAEKVKEAMAKLMEVSPEEAGKMMATMDKVNAVNPANQIEANKVYKNKPEIV